MRNSKIRQKQEKKLKPLTGDYWDNMPSSVMFVKMMAAGNAPIGLETYKKALEEGGEIYFPDEFEFKRKWALVPQDVKDAYSNDPNSQWGLFGVIDKDEPIEMQNWPGIVSATDHDWRVRNEWYNSDKYKAKQLEQAHKKVQTYNDYFSKYGLTKTLEDFI